LRIYPFNPDVKPLASEALRIVLYAP